MKRNSQLNGDPRNQNTEQAERAILAILLRNSERIAQAQSQVVPEDFSQRQHQILYREMLRLHAAQSPVDLAAVSTHFECTEQLDAVGGPQFLMEINDTAGASENLQYFIKHLLARRVQCTLRQALATPMSAHMLQQTLDHAFRRLGPSASHTAIGRLASMDNSFECIDLLGSPSTEPALLFPFWSGQEGDHLILAGPRSSGKSTMAAEIGLAAALPWKKGIAVGGVYRWNLELLGDRRIALIDGENSKQRWQSLLRRLVEHSGDDPSRARELIEERILYVSAHKLGLRERSQWTSRSERLAEALAGRNVAFAILDSAARVWGAADLNETHWVQEGYAPFAAACKDQAPPISSLMLAHIRREPANQSPATGPLGTSSQDNNADALIIIRRNDDILSLEHHKNRRAWWIRDKSTIQIELPRDRYGFEPSGNWASTWSHDPPNVAGTSSASGSTRARILSVIEERGEAGIAIAELAQIVGLSTRQVRRHVQALRASDEVRELHRGVVVAAVARTAPHPLLKSKGVGPECPDAPTDSETLTSNTADAGAKTRAKKTSETPTLPAATISERADMRQSVDVRGTRPK